MTVSTTVVKLEDGPRNAIFHLYGEVTAGDQEFNVKKVDITTLSLLGQSIAGAGQPGGRNQAPTHLSLEEIKFATHNLMVHLVWESGVGTHARIWLCPPNFSDHQKFRRGQPINNNAPSRTGNVLLSTVNETGSFTNDAAALDGRYDIMLWFHKKYE